MDVKDPATKKQMDYLLHTFAPKIEQHANSLRSQNLVPSHIENSDLHEPGIYGLMEAVGKWKNSRAAMGAKTDEEKLSSFHKYADQRIRGRMLDHIAEQDPTKRFKAKFSGTYGTGENEAPPVTQVSPSSAPKSK